MAVSYEPPRNYRVSWISSTSENHQSLESNRWKHMTDGSTP